MAFTVLKARLIPSPDGINAIARRVNAIARRIHPIHGRLPVVARRDNAHTRRQLQLSPRLPRCAAIPRLVRTLSDLYRRGGAGWAAFPGEGTVDFLSIMSMSVSGIDAGALPALTNSSTASVPSPSDSGTNADQPFSPLERADLETTSAFAGRLPMGRPRASCKASGIRVRYALVPIGRTTLATTTPTSKPTTNVTSDAKPRRSIVWSAIDEYPYATTVTWKNAILIHTIPSPSPAVHKSK
jgi:hypothetical protein